MKIRFRDAARVPSTLEPDTTWAELERIREKHNKLTPDVIIEESRDESAPLHSAFEWNDSRAAEEYRKTQARYLVRSIEVTIEETDPPTAYYVNIAIGIENEYKPVTVVVKNADECKDALERALSRLRSAVQAFEEYEHYLNKYGKKPPKKTIQAINLLRRAQDSLGREQVGQ